MYMNEISALGRNTYLRSLAEQRAEFLPAHPILTTRKARPTRNFISGFLCPNFCRPIDNIAATAYPNRAVAIPETFSDHLGGQI
jgi:hypothetical protein